MEYRAEVFGVGIGFNAEDGTELDDFLKQHKEAGDLTTALEKEVLFNDGLVVLRLNVLKGYVQLHYFRMAGLTEDLMEEGALQIVARMDADDDLRLAVYKYAEALDSRYGESLKPLVDKALELSDDLGEPYALALQELEQAMGGILDSFINDVVKEIQESTQEPEM